MCEGINIFVSGRTGTGKSHLVKRAIADCPRLFVYLTKPEDHDYPGLYFNGADEQNRQLMLWWWRWCAEHGRRFRIVYRPKDKFDFLEFDQICGIAYSLGYMTVVAEEIGTYVSSSIFKKAGYGQRFKALITNGRTRGMNVWLLNQRPSGVPVELKSEARLAYIFHSNEPCDVEYIEHKFGVAAANALATLKEHEHVYWKETGEVTVGKAAA